MFLFLIFDKTSGQTGSRTLVAQWVR